MPRRLSVSTHKGEEVAETFSQFPNVAHNLKATAKCILATEIVSVVPLF